LILIQLLTRPLRYGRSRRLDSVPRRIVFARCSDTPVSTLSGKRMISGMRWTCKARS
jgi:hypothetical protein